MIFRKKIVGILGLFISCGSFSQTVKTSLDGNYVAVNEPVDFNRADYNRSTFIVESLIDKSKEVITGVTREFEFTSNSKAILYSSNDTFHLLSLEGKSDKEFFDIASFQQPQTADINSGWIGLLKKGPDHELIVYNQETQTKHIYSGIEKFEFSPNSNGLLLQKKTRANGIDASALSWVDLQSGKEFVIWSADSVGMPTIANYIFDENGKHLAICAFDKKQGNSIWLYTIGKHTSELLVDNGELKGYPGLHVDKAPLLCFDLESNRLLFLVKEDRRPVNDSIIQLSEDVDIWSYTDPVIMSYQKKFIDNTRQYVFSISTENHELTRLEEESELISGTVLIASTKRGFDPNSGWLENLSSSHIISSNGYVLVVRWKGDITSAVPAYPYMTAEWNWSEANRVSVYLESIKDGSRKLVKENMRRSYGKRIEDPSPLFQFSPGGKYVIYYDEDFKSYWSFEISTGVKRNLSQKIAIGLLLAGSRHRATPDIHAPIGIVGWMNDGECVLISDCYTDIWKVDMKGTKPPRNLTQSYCRKYHLTRGGPVSTSENDVFKNSDKIHFNLESNTSTERGFLLVSMDFSHPPVIKMSNFLTKILNKNSRGKYLVEQQSVTESPKYSTTNDFISFTPQSTINSNLGDVPVVNKSVISYKTSNGKKGFGVLYKPKDFDSSRKYPVLFSYYESTNLNSYNEDLGGLNAPGGRNPLKNDYLVFVPDIRYEDTLKTNLESAFDYVTSAAKQLCKMRCVNSRAIGISGGSFGAMETNYIVTHTTMFAAAFSSAGLTDYVSNFGIEENDDQGFPRTEAVGQPALIGNIWNNRERIINNSPVFLADKVTTPILLVANQTDFRVPSSQGIEFFKALRRLGKRVWMLRYPTAGHGFYTDGAIRMMQFFDHYLKGMPAPVWMTRGLPAKLKGTSLGLEYDTLMKTPGRSLLYESSPTTEGPREKEMLYDGKVHLVRDAIKEEKLTDND